MCAACLISCRSSKDAGESASQLTDLMIGYCQLRISLPIFVAQQEGIFAKHGIHANLLMYPTAQPMMQALVEGKVQIAGYTAMPITYDGMARSGTKLLFITTMIEDQDHRISYLLRRTTKPGTMPTIRSIHDLKGKKIGVLPTSAYTGWMKAILQANGVNPNQVVIQPIAPDQEAAALRSGGVDALFTNDPAATAAIRAGVAELVSNTVECPKYIENPFPFGSFNVSKAWADQNPQLYQRLVAAINEAAEFVNEHPDQAKKDMVPYLPPQFRGDVAYYADAKYLLTGQSSDEMYQHLADLFLKMGIIQQPVSLHGLVVTQ
jgi:NitT/TauT family transport system substrate-binding protein